MKYSYFQKILLLFLLFNTYPCFAEWQVQDAAIMGTTIRVEVWHEDIEVRKKGITQVLDEMERVNQLMSPYIKESQLSKINKHAYDKPIKVDKDIFGLIKRSIEVSKLTNGAFDITYASVGHLFNYRKELRPSDKEIAEAKQFIDYRNINLNEAKHTISFSKEGVRIDLGGIAKGFAVDQAIMKLKEVGIEHALVSAGGDTGILGDRRGRPWLVGIRDPRQPEEVLAMMPLQDEALSTSGDYERFFIEEGVRYHHIINPSTGKSASEIRSASILAADATTTDALSTSVFVLGVQKGLQLLNSIDGTEGVIIDQQGKLYYSKGLNKEEN